MGLLSIVLLLLESKRELKKFVLTHYWIEIPEKYRTNEIKSDKKCEIKNDIKSDVKNGSKVIVLSDLHNKEYGTCNQRLIQAINNEKPDMIWVVGDMLIGKEKETTEVPLSLMKALQKIAPIYYSNGNHEQRLKEEAYKYGDKYEQYKQTLKEAGVHFLSNQEQEVTLGNQPVSLIGLEIPLGCYKKGKYDKFSVEEIEALVGKKRPKFQVLLAHNPIHSQNYIEWGADLVISGHLHGGIIRLPFIGGLISTQLGILPKYSGDMYKVGTSHIIVSRGIGEHTIKIRFMNQPEVVVLHIS